MSAENLNPKEAVSSSSSPEFRDGDSEPLEPNRSLVPVDSSGNGSERDSVFSWFLGWFGRRKNGATIREDLADALSDDAGFAQGFSPEERIMLSSILRLQDMRVEDVMVPRTDIIAVGDDTSLAELLKMFEDSGHSRMPVFGENLDDPVGMIHIRDVVAHIFKSAKLSRAEISRRKTKLPANLDLKKVNLSRTINETRIVREVMFIPPSMGARELMARMQAERVQIALVIDEYGGTDGLVTLEDIVEEIVGDIEDEHDDEQVHVQDQGDGTYLCDAKAELEDIVEEIVGDIEDEHDDEQVHVQDQGDGTYLCDAKAELEDIRQLIGGDFMFGEHEEDVDTIGGLIFDILGRVPVRGEVLAKNGFEFRIMDADPRRIRRIELVRSSRRRPKRN